MLVISYNAERGGMLVADRDGTRFKLSFDHCKQCRGLVRVLEPLGPDGEPERVCKCSVTGKKAA